MLSFDNAYNGDIKKIKDKDLFLLTFKNLYYPKEKIENLNSTFLEKFKINSKDNNLYITFKSKEDIDVSLTNINNKFGIRIRIIPQKILEQQKEQNLNLSVLNTIKKTENKNTLADYDYTNYIYVMAVLIGLVVVLFILKRNLNSKIGLNIESFDIVFQRPLDRNNNFTILEYNNKRYAMVIGNSNILLEKYDAPTDIKKDENSFDAMFEQNKKRIQDLIIKKQKN